MPYLLELPKGPEIDFQGLWGHKEINPSFSKELWQAAEWSQKGNAYPDKAHKGPIRGLYQGRPTGEVHSQKWDQDNSQHYVQQVHERHRWDKIQAI